MDRMYDYLINKIFTIPYIDKMINRTSMDTFFQCVSRHIKDDNNVTYGEAISKIYHYMDSSYRNEYFFKNTIFNKLLIEKHDLYSTAALTELPIADSKADFIMINGKGIVYEIKTDLDNLNRLASQISDYYKAFKYVYVVVGCKQYERVKEFLKDTKVGIYVLYKSGNLLCRKLARCNEKNLSYEGIFQILRKTEFENIILKYYGKLPTVNNFYYYRECFKWISQINIKTLQKDMLQSLKQRTVLIVKDEFKEQIPYELRFYAYFTKNNTNKYQVIQEFWNDKMEV